MKLDDLLFEHVASLVNAEYGISSDNPDLNGEVVVYEPLDDITYIIDRVTKSTDGTFTIHLGEPAE